MNVLAKLQVSLPFEVAVLRDAQYDSEEYMEGSYLVKIEVPFCSGAPGRLDRPDEMLFDGQPCDSADALVIWFEKESFDRRVGHTMDPPDSLVQQVLDRFVRRLRFISEAKDARPFNFTSVRWSLTYLNDEKAALDKQEGLLRKRHGSRFTYSTIWCDHEVWNATRLLPTDFDVPAWHEILVDAQACLPHVGSAVVLAATALELFITEVLNRMAKNSNVAPPLWNWIIGRKANEPFVDEQFDTLLTVLCGHSLKEDPALWEIFKNLKSARNNYVHTGIAQVSREALPLSPDQSQLLIQGARKIVERVTGWLPADARWPVFTRQDQSGGRGIIRKRIASTGTVGSFLVVNGGSDANLHIAPSSPNVVRWTHPSRSKWG
jgi:hypothetical protein